MRGLQEALRQDQPLRGPARTLVHRVLLTCELSLMLCSLLRESLQQVLRRLQRASEFWRRLVVSGNWYVAMRLGPSMLKKPGPQNPKTPKPQNPLNLNKFF